MKFILLLMFFLLTMNCNINKVSNTHGFRLLDKKYEQITLNSSNKNDIRKIIGPPSSVSKFDNLWYFFERKKRNKGNKKTA